MSDDNDFEPEDSGPVKPNPFRSSSSNTPSPSPSPSPSSAAPASSASQQAGKRQKTGGKQKGWRKASSTMSNGRFTEEDLYIFVPKDSIATDDQKRFIELCDKMLIDLGTDSISEIDLEEICLYYRERLLIDGLHRTMALANGTTDTTLIVHLEKLNKGAETRKSNLGARFVDKGKKRKDNNTSTLMELLSNYSDNKMDFEVAASKKASEIEEHKKTFTNTADYMTSHAGSKKSTESES